MYRTIVPIKLGLLVVATLGLVLFTAVAVPYHAYAQAPPELIEPTGIDPSVVKKTKGDATDCAFSSGAGDSSTNCIARDINAIANFVTAGVGIVVTIMIVISGLRYTLARDNAQEIQKAKLMIFNSLIALVALLFVYSFIQWVTPGGAF